jgi:short-subunit dehydrogenase
MSDLRDAVVVLTGAAGGIGAATARALVARGARVALVDRDEVGLTTLAAELAAAVTSHPFDLRDIDGMDHLAAQILEAHGSIDVLINNAGLTVHAPFARMSREEIDRVFDVDLRAAVHATRVFLPHIRESNRGHVVFVSSMAGLEPFPTQTTYSAAKFGLRGFGAALRIELRAEGIGVSTVLPGTIATGFLAAADSHDPELTNTLAGLMQRFGTSPDRVGRAIVRGIERNRGTLRVGWDCWLVSFVGWLVPPLLPFVLRVAYGRRLLGQL